MGFPGSSAGKESTCNVGDLGSIPGLGWFPGEGNGYPLQYSGLENSTGCVFHGVTKSHTGLNDFHFHFIWHDLEKIDFNYFSWWYILNLKETTLKFFFKCFQYVLKFFTCPENIQLHCLKSFLLHILTVLTCFQIPKNDIETIRKGFP